MRSSIPIPHTFVLRGQAIAVTSDGAAAAMSPAADARSGMVSLEPR